MKNNILGNIIFLVLLIVTLLNGSDVKAQDSIYKSIITVDFVSPTMSYAPRWNVGYIRKVSKRFWTGLEIGYGNYNSSINFAAGGDWIEKDYKLFEIKPSVYFDLGYGVKSKHFVSAELFYINHKDKLVDSWYFNPKNNIDYDYASANYKRVKYGLNFNYNLFLYFGKRVSLMQVTGFGIKFRDTKFSDINSKTNRPDDNDDDEFAFFENNFLRSEGKTTSFNVNLDFKLTYRIR